MITNSDWLKPKSKPCHHPLSLDCIEKLVECMGSIGIEEMDCDTFFKTQEILRDETDDSEFLEFGIENLDELFLYIIRGYLIIRIRWNITGKMWFLMEGKLIYKSNT